MVLAITHAGVPQVKDSLILITLLVELGVAAAFAAILARTTTFKNLLLNPHRTRRQKLATGGDDLCATDGGRVDSRACAQFPRGGPFL